MRIQAGILSNLWNRISSSLPQVRLPNLARSIDSFTLGNSPTPRSPLDTGGLVASLAHQGLSPEAIATSIDGTAHTAGHRNLYLARKVVDVMTTQNQILAGPQPALEAKERLKSALHTFLRSNQTFDTQWLIYLLQSIGSPETIVLLANLHPAGPHTLEVVPHSAFDNAVPGYSLAGKTGFYHHRRNQGLQDRLLVRGLPDGLSTDEAMLETLINRLLAAMHEWEHWRHASFRFSRSENPVKEIMCGLEEHRLLLRVHKFDLLEQAVAKGQTLAQFFQAMEKAPSNSVIARLWSRFFG